MATGLLARLEGLRIERGMQAVRAEASSNAQQFYLRRGYRVSGPRTTGGAGREPNEVAAEAYPAGVVVPVSTFDPKAIPDPQGKQVLFACRSGKRSVTASPAAQAAALPYDKHLAGGILGWKAAGQPTKV